MEIPQGQRQFECEHCQSAILVPIDLPPTSAPCPICNEITTSPPLEQEAPPIEDDRPMDHKDYAGDESGGGSGLLWALAALTFVALLVGGFFLLKKFRVEDKPPEKSLVPDASPSEIENKVVSLGVEEETLTVLNKFLTATSIDERAKYVIGKEATIPDMNAFYGDEQLEEEALRADFFTEWVMEEADTERGIYLLQFVLPKRFKLGELFNPITDLKTQLSLQEPDLQTRSKGYRQNFEMEAIRALVFLKRVDGELLIDWYTYVQTKDRGLRNFLRYPIAGKSGTFRVVIVEDATTIYEDDSSIRNFRVLDPAHAVEDYGVASVNKGSQVGKTLEKLAWTDVPGKDLANSGSGATLVLKWSTDESPVLKIAEVICWEFLGVGGDPSNLVSSN